MLNDNDEFLDTNYNKICGEVIRKYRERKGYSLQELSDKINNEVTRQALFRYEKGICNIKIGMFKKIARALGQMPSDMFEEVALKYLHFIEENKDNYDL